MIARLLALAALVVLLTGGCTTETSGTAGPASGLRPRPLTDPTVKQVLLDEAALSRMFHQHFNIDPEIPPRSGGRDILLNSYRKGSPADCVGVVTLLNSATYESAPVNYVAHETWWHTDDSASIVSVAEGVVALPTATEAAAQFTRFSEQWKKCNGTPVTLQAASLTFTDTVESVTEANSVVAASIAQGRATSTGSAARAIGLRGNCLIDVQVNFFSTATGDPQTSAVDIAHAMMDKVSALS